MDNTRDLAKFGAREIEEARQLMNAFALKNKTQYFGTEGVAVEFNPMSGKVFLVDEDYQVAVVEGEDLVDFITCGECGYEGTLDDYAYDQPNGNANECCKEQFAEAETG